ncbi:hypothetical protein C8F01DRAFT_1238962 [Mycena amicta]|nr:hypothetical protein C8F01DRAFT_1238962 [Mycena amicta]
MCGRGRVAAAARRLVVPEIGRQNGSKNRAVTEKGAHTLTGLEAGAQWTWGATLRVQLAGVLGACGMVGRSAAEGAQRRHDGRPVVWTGEGGEAQKARAGRERRRQGRGSGGGKKEGNATWHHFFECNVQDNVQVQTGRPLPLKPGTRSFHTIRNQPENRKHLTRFKTPWSAAARPGVSVKNGTCLHGSRTSQGRMSVLVQCQKDSFAASFFKSVAGIPICQDRRIALQRVYKDAKLPAQSPQPSLVDSTNSTNTDRAHSSLPTFLSRSTISGYRFAISSRKSMSANSRLSINAPEFDNQIYTLQEIHQVVNRIRREPRLVPGGDLTMFNLDMESARASSRSGTLLPQDK